VRVARRQGRLELTAIADDSNARERVEGVIGSHIERFAFRGLRPLPRGRPAGPGRRHPRNHEIAARLYVSENTVHHHVSAILRKLSVPTRGQAAAEAARLGIGRR
jgi:hypothetical protein